MLAQLESIGKLNDQRRGIWGAYHAAFATLEADGLVRRPIIPADCVHNGHLYYLLLPSLTQRTAVLAGMKARGIGAIFHYVPLHSSPAGKRFGRTHSGRLPVTDRAGDTLLRLPLFPELGGDVERVCEEVNTLVRSTAA